MSYAYEVRGGEILAATEKDAARAAEVLRGIGVDCEAPQKMRDGSGYTFDVYASNWLKYDEDDYQPVAETAICGSYISFRGEDDNVWTLVFSDGTIIDFNGEVRWDSTEPSEADNVLLEKLEEYTEPDEGTIRSILSTDSRSAVSLKNLGNLVKLVEFKRPQTKEKILTVIREDLSLREKYGLV